MAPLPRGMQLVAFACLVACSRKSAAIDAGPSASVSAAAPIFFDGPECPLPLHPDYCEGECRAFVAREASHHAMRVIAPNAWATGTCGPYRVFAEDDAAFGDAGIVEWYDDRGQLVAAEDRRAEGCGRFGAVPSCTPSLTWNAANKPHVRITEITANGLAPSLVRRIVRQQLGRLLICYQNRSPKSVALAGKLVVAFDVDHAGHPTPSHQALGDSLADAQVTACMLSAIDEAIYPEPTGGKATATITIEISP